MKEGCILMGAAFFFRSKKLLLEAVHKEKPIQ